MPSKNLFKSKTFWVNVASIAVAVGSGSFGVSLAPNAATILLAAGNIALRLLTNEPVHVLPPDA